MTKTDLLTALAGKFYQVLTPKLERTEGDIGWYLVGCYDKGTDIIVRVNISFYVEKEGEVDEAAYWSQAEPKPTPSTPPTTFASELQTYINTKITDSTIEGAVLESVSEVTKTAVGKAYIVVGSDVVEKKVLFDKDGDNIQYRVITE